MNMPLRVVTKVLPGNRVEIEVPSDLNVGAQVEVTVQELAPAAPAKPSVLEIIESYDGPRQFNTAEEVDAYLREERDSWDR
jgi:hypothetical protein